MPIPIALGAALIGAGSSIGGGLIQSASQRRRERRAMENQRELMDLQQKHQMELNKQGQQLQQETWRNTNYGAQVEMLKEAGMNPALLYGKGGSGGVTGSQGGGSAAGGSAPAPQHVPNYMDLNAIANIALLKSQKDKNDADADKARADADKTRGVDTTKTENEILNIAADTQNKDAQNDILQIDRTIKELDARLKNSTLNTHIKIVGDELIKLKEEIKLLKQNANIAESTYLNVVRISELEVVKSYLTNSLLRSQISKTNKEASAIADEIAIKYQQLGINKDNLSNEQMKTKISEFEAMIKANYPNIWNVAGAGIMQIINGWNYTTLGMEGVNKYENIKK